MRHSTWTCNFIHDRLLRWYKILFKTGSRQTNITWWGLYIYTDNVQQCLTIDLKAIEKNINIIHLWYLQRVFPSLRDKNNIFLIYTIYHFRPTQWSKEARGKRTRKEFHQLQEVYLKLWKPTRFVCCTNKTFNHQKNTVVMTTKTRIWITVAERNPQKDFQVLKKLAFFSAVQK